MAVVMLAAGEKTRRFKITFSKINWNHEKDEEPMNPVYTDDNSTPILKTELHQEIPHSHFQFQVTSVHTVEQQSRQLASLLHLGDRSSKAAQQCRVRVRSP